MKNSIISGNFNNNWNVLMAIILICLATGYTVWTFDFVNDLIPILGLVDDVIIDLTALCNLIIQLIKCFKH